MAAHGFLWGGTFKQPDKPHFYMDPEKISGNADELKAAADKASDYYNNRTESCLTISL